MSSHSLFKLTKDGVTRRVTLPSNALWLDVASKIETLYNIPLERVGVLYIDADGDEITISTQEELQDYYRARGPSSSNEFVKFTVVDLNSLRAVNDKSPPDTPQTSQHMQDKSSRNTFGAIPINLEEDWHSIPGFDLFAPSGSIRFEELSTDTGSRINDGNREKRSAASSESASTVTPKNRSFGGDDEISSIESVIGNDTPKKPPVHVYNRRSSSHTSVSIIGDRPESVSSSPRSPRSPLDAIPDPPLPDLEQPSTASANPSLTSDVAVLLNTITTIFSSHPELAEVLRNILRNVGNGAYWNGCQERVAQAAEEIRRSTQDLRSQVAEATAFTSDTEQQASRRIAEAIGNIVRSLGQMALDPNTTQDPPDERRTDPDRSHPTFWSIFGQPLHSPYPPSSQHSGVPPPPPPHLPHPPRPCRGRSFHHPHLPPRPHFPFGHWGSPMGPPPYMGPPPPHGPHFPWPPPAGNNAAHSDISDDDISEAEDAEISMYGVSMLSPQAQREKVQAAKEAYKVEKEKYRKEKHARRLARNRPINAERNSGASSTAQPVVPTPASVDPPPLGNEAQVTQLISHGRGQFPSLEHFSIPGSQNLHGSGRARHRRESSTAEATRTRVTRKLSDMGFDDPSIGRRVSMHISDNVAPGKLTEDSIVSSVVEELLNSTSRPAGPSGSRHD